MRAAASQPSTVADSLETALQTSQARADADRLETKERLVKQRRALIAKRDRGYEDYVAARIYEDFRTRKSEQ